MLCLLNLDIEKSAPLGVLSRWIVVVLKEWRVERQECDSWTILLFKGDSQEVDRGDLVVPLGCKHHLTILLPTRGNIAAWAEVVLLPI